MCTVIHINVSGHCITRQQQYHIRQIYWNKSVRQDMCNANTIKQSLQEARNISK